MAQLEWRKNEEFGNYILKGNQFYISYQPKPWSPLGASPPETALVIMNENGVKFLILEGDFRKEYEKRIDNLEECIKFFKENKKYKSMWSDDID